MGKRAPEPLATSLQELVPHGDRDHFVYLWRRTLDGKNVAAGIHVEHLTALGDGDFEVTLSEDGGAIGHSRFRDDGTSLLLLSEDLGPQLRLSYDPPLPQLAVPLYRGQQRSTAVATVSRSSDQQSVETLPVTQVTEATVAPPVHAAIGEYAQAIEIHSVRTLEFPHGPFELDTTAVLVPGIGEIRSRGKATGAAVLYRELACATIGGKRIGNCRDLRERIQEWERARPADLP